MYACLEQPIPDLPQLTHVGHCYGPGDTEVERHYHLGFEFVYIVNGPGLLSAGTTERAVHVDDDDLIVTPPKVDHDFRLAAERTEYYWLGVQTTSEIGLSRLHSRSPGRLMNDTHDPVSYIHAPPEFGAIEELGSALPPLGITRIRRAAEFRRVFEEVYEESTLRRPFARHVVFGRLLSLFALLHRRLAHPGPVTARSREVAVAIDYVRAHPDLPISLEAIADRVGLSQSHFGRVFRSEVGIPFGRFLLDVRLALAKRLLVDGRPVREVAAASGFASQQTFARAFGRLVGCTPSHYRATVERLE